MTRSLIQYLSTYSPLSSSDRQKIEDSFQLKKFKKKTFLLREGEICDFEAFIIQGCIRSYYIDSNGFEVILTFATENWWVGDLCGLQENKPGKMFIETLEDTEVLMIYRDEKEKLLREVPILERIFRLIVQRHLRSYQERMFSYIAQSAEERYSHFLVQYPTLPQRVPQRLIASYLGVSQEFLSRLRKKKAKK